MAKIRTVIAAKLRGKVFFSTLWMAIGLAGVLNDPELMQIVAELAKNPSAIVARGITDPKYVKQTQERAAAGLENYRRRVGP